jgi:protein-disulfide isomerase-like protein with CxxC motif
LARGPRGSAPPARVGARVARAYPLVVAAITAIHFTDPACPWAYSARPAHARLRWRFGDQIEWRLVLIGLSESAEAYEARGYTPDRLLDTQHRFSKRFGMPYSFEMKPRMAGTSRACRAIVAARELDPALGEAALRALQLMHFTTPRLLDDDDDLRAALAAVPGLDADAIVASIDDPAIVAAYQADRALARSAEGSPTHAQDRFSTSDGPVRYTAPSVIFEDEHGRHLEVGGFQPFEAYDTALANLAVGLERRPAPTDPLEALHEFPDGLTTAELASVMRPSDLVDADIEATAAELAALAEAGTVSREPAGRDAIWRAALSASVPNYSTEDIDRPA